MPQGQVLEFSGVTKRFGAVTAVEGLSARVEPGAVTGFLGPNGAGKTTSLRILLGLVRATGGTATIGGVEYAKLADPLRSVGAVLEASSFHPGRTAANHLRVYARAAGISNARVDDVLGLVGLSDAAGRKVGGFSLGMRQRLGLAYAMLGDPGVLVLDEPANGLDPEGIKWMRGFMRDLAREGRTVLVSSHLLTEVQQTVDAILVIARGRLVFQGGLEELADPSEYVTVVDSPDRAALGSALGEAGVAYELLRSGLTVRGSDPVAVGAVAAGAGVALSALQRRGPALEEVFLELVNGERVHASAGAASAAAAVGAVAEGAEGSDDSAAVTDASAAAVDETGADTHEVEWVDADVEAPADEVEAYVEASADEVESDTTDSEPDTTDAEPGTTDADATEADHAAATDADATEADDAEADEADDAAAAAVASELDAEAGVTSGASIAAGAGAGAWAVTGDGTVEDTRTPAGGVDSASPAEPPVATAGFAVASTGIIDIVPTAARETDPGADASADTSEAATADDDLAGDPEDADPGADASADTSEAATADDDGAGDPEDADPDVEAIGEIDDELESALAEDDAGAHLPAGATRTDSDLAADAFFAAFDDSGAPIDAAPDGHRPREDAADDSAGGEASTAPDDQTGDASPPHDGDADAPERHEEGEQR